MHGLTIKKQAVKEDVSQKIGEHEEVGKRANDEYSGPAAREGGREFLELAVR